MRMGNGALLRDQNLNLNLKRLCTIPKSHPSSTTHGEGFRGVTCPKRYHRYHAHWGLSDADTWTRWERQNRKRRSVELYIVAYLDDGLLFTGEIK